MTIQAYRKNKALTGKELSANTIASLLVAQNIDSVSMLSTDREMQYELMYFLNRERAIGYWLDNGWLCQDNNVLYLTKSGLDEVESREAGEALNSNGRKKAVNVSPALIAEARTFIITGQVEAETPILSKDFEIDSGC